MSDPLRGGRRKQKRYGLHRVPAQATRPIRACYADPVYPARARYYSVPGTPEFHPDSMRWDDPAAHIELMARLEAEFPDGWAMSTSSDAVRALWPASPPGTQLAMWGRGGPRLNLRVVPGWEAVLYRVDVVKVPGRPAAMDSTAVMPKSSS